MGPFEPFSRKYGLSGKVVSAAALIAGIGSAIGLARIDVPGATGSVNTDLDAKVRAAREAFSSSDFVLVNIKGADEAGHDGDARAKMAFIEKIDLALAPLTELQDTITIVCADHSTPCSIKGPQRRPSTSCHLR